MLDSRPRCKGCGSDKGECARWRRCQDCRCAVAKTGGQARATLRENATLRQQHSKEERQTRGLVDKRAAETGIQLTPGPLSSLELTRQIRRVRASASRQPARTSPELPPNLCSGPAAPPNPHAPLKRNLEIEYKVGCPSRTRLLKL